MNSADWYTKQLKENGHVIVKNTGIKDPKDFKQWTKSLFDGKLMKYEGGECSRDDIGDGVLNVNTFEPPVMDIVLHNEMSYQDYFPERIAFCGVNPSKLGGVTTLGDNTRISKYMPAHLKEKILKLGFMVTHSLQNLDALKSGKEPRWYNTWQDAYLVDNKESLLKILEKEGYKDIRFGENDRLYIKKKMRSEHYQDGELYFIDTLVSSHSTYFQYQEYLCDFPPEERPFHTLWGDGSELSDQEYY